MALGDRLVQGRTLGMFALVLPQHRTQLVVGRSFGFSRYGRHNQNSSDQLVSKSVIVFADGIKFGRREQHTRAVWTEYRSVVRLFRLELRSCRFREA